MKLIRQTTHDALASIEGALGPGIAQRTPEKPAFFDKIILFITNIELPLVGFHESAARMRKRGRHNLDSAILDVSQREDA
ncbi:hypothetical protein ACET3Z_009520 [Daucus carota]